MLGNKRNRGYDNRDPVLARTANLVISSGPDPFQRSDAALIAHPPVELRPVQTGNHRRRGSFDLVRVRLSGPRNLFWQPVRGKQQTGWVLVTGSRVEHRSYQPSHRFDKARIGGVAAHD